MVKPFSQNKDSPCGVNEPHGLVLSPMPRPLCAETPPTANQGSP